MDWWVRKPLGWWNRVSVVITYPVRTPVWAGCSISGEDEEEAHTHSHLHGGHDGSVRCPGGGMKYSQVYHDL